MLQTALVMFDLPWKTVPNPAGTMHDINRISILNSCSLCTEQCSVWPVAHVSTWLQVLVCETQRSPALSLAPIMQCSSAQSELLYQIETGMFS